MNILGWLLTPYLTKQLEAQIGILMALQDDINALTAQVAKGTGEVLAAIEELEAQFAAGETVDLTELKSAAQALDDVVADAVEPVEE